MPQTPNSPEIFIIQNQNPGDFYDDPDLAATLVASNLTRNDGKPVKYYSAYHANVVDKHFEWMKDYGIDGVWCLNNHI